MNSFTFNSKNAPSFLKRYKVLLLGLFLFVISQFMILFISETSQTSSKQVVKEKRSWAKTKSFIKAEPETDLIFFFGNSHMASGIIPDVFDAANDRSSTSYNLSLVGLQLPVHYFLLKDYLCHHPPPQYILLNPLSQGYDIESFPSYSIQGAGLDEALLYAFYRKNMDVFFNYIFPARAHWPETVRYFTGKIISIMPSTVREQHKKLYLERFGTTETWGHNRPYFYESQFLKPEELHRKRIDLLRKQRGFYYIIEESVIGGQVTEEYLNNVGIRLDPCPTRLENSPYEIQEISPDTKRPPSLIDPLTIKFFQLAQNNNITVVLLPDYSMSHYKDGCIEKTGRYVPGISALSQYLLNTYSNVYSLNSTRQIEYPFTLFSDPSHLNPQGATIHSRNMALAFKQFKRKSKARQHKPILLTK